MIFYHFAIVYSIFLEALEFDHWVPLLIECFYRDSSNVRRQIVVSLTSTKIYIVLTAYEYVIKGKAILAQICWKYMIGDESHRKKY